MQTIRTELERLVDKHAVTEDSMPFHCIHGYLTALAICPVGIPQTEIIKNILDGTPSLGDDKPALNNALDALKDDVDRSFNEEDGFTLPCEFEPEGDKEEALEDWCSGFMEAHFLDEDAWFQHHEQEVCELLLPIMLASGLFDDEPEFKDMLKDEQLTDEMYSQIPEVLMELYLMFNSPEDIRSKDSGKNRKK